MGRKSNQWANPRAAATDADDSAAMGPRCPPPAPLPGRGHHVVMHIKKGTSVETSVARSVINALK